MTDEHTGVPDPQDHAPPPPEAPNPPDMGGTSPARPSSGVESMFSTGEGLVAVSGIALLLIWLIFEVITDEYGVPYIALVLAAIAAIAPRLNPDSWGWLPPMPTLMRACGWLLTIVGVTVIVGDIETNVFDEDGGTIIAAVLSWAAYVVAFLGARQIDT